MTHGGNIYKTSYEMDMSTMCAYPTSQHALLHWKCVLRCCESFSRIDLPCRQSVRHHSNTSPTIRFHVYHLIAHYTVHVRSLLDEENFCCQCLFDPASVPPEKYIQEKILCSYFHTSFYIPSIKKLSFNLPHLHILGIHNCGNTLSEVFKHRRAFQYIFCHCDYANIVVASFTHQIQL